MKRKLPRTLCKIFNGRTSYAQYCQDDYQGEIKYLDKLSDEELEWLNNFNLAYYYRSKKAADKIGMPVEMLRKSYNSHRSVINDYFSKEPHQSLNEDEDEEKNEKEERGV